MSARKQGTSRPKKFARRETSMPLSEFPEAARLAIERVVLEKKPPPRFKLLGAGGHRPVAMIPSRAWYEWYWHRGIDPDRIREKIPTSTRKAVIARDGLVCGICSESVDPGDVHIDHIKPVIAGGPTRLENLRVTHSKCNLAKGGAWEDEAV